MLYIMYIHNYTFYFTMCTDQLKNTKFLYLFIICVFMNCFFFNFILSLQIETK